MSNKEKDPQPAAKPNVSIFLAPEDAGGLVSAGPYAVGVRHDGVPAELAEQLATRYGFTTVPADFVPAKKEG